jgi:hypothetical protein
MFVIIRTSDVSSFFLCSLKIATGTPNDIVCLCASEHLPCCTNCTEGFAIPLNIKGLIESKLESVEQEPTAAAEDEDFFYEPLGLEDLAVVKNVDQVIQIVVPPKKKVDEDTGSATSFRDTEGNKSGASKKAASNFIPTTIGRVRATSGASKGSKGGSDGDSGDEKMMPGKVTRAATGPMPITIPAAAQAALVPGASMAATLKRETEQQEMERQRVSLVQYWTIFMVSRD